MSSRTLLHLLVIVIVAIGIYFFPEFRESSANGGFENAERESDFPREALTTPSDRLQEILKLGGISGRAIGVDGKPLRGIPLNSVGLELSGDARSLAGEPAAHSKGDGSFEIESANLGDSIAVHGADFAILAERRLVRADESIELLLVVAPTARVAGRIIGARGVETVSFQATHPLPEEARGPEAQSEVVFQRSLTVESDGSFDFGKLPCSDAAFLLTSDSQGKPHRLAIPRTGATAAQIDLR